uniref:Putative disease resistance RPP13-like protein 1 n=1 Tax=Anthurium amnicola TaxID=1678845 RepID=A0A1D1XBZ8_9ARAE
MLLSDGGGYQDRSFRVVSVVGMGGVGKTTLAQLVFNDKRVGAHFRARLWVCVSDSFDVMKLTRDILKQLLGRSCELQELSSLQQLLRKELAGKMFLLVLDDVWDVSQECWDALWVSLLDGAKGSRVLLTTRNESVSRASGAMDMYPLGCLSDDDCWSLFAQRAFYGSSMDDYQHLVRTGREIVRKCRGLPLTVKMLAGLLFGEFSLDRWEDILRSDLWELPEGKDYILPALKLSYYHLPSHVKPCFAYCAVFPKGYKFVRDELVFLWMVQGYVKPDTIIGSGSECFNCLLRRSFFQPSGDGRFLMHDLIRDLALSNRGGECSSLEGDATSSNSSRKARHLWFQDTEDQGTLLSCGSTSDYFSPHLRTCFLIGHSRVFPDAGRGQSLSQRLGDTFQSMSNLRALHLCGWEVAELPDSLGNLKLLRYLSIRHMVKLIRLPETLGNLLYLQTLEILDCFDLEELPNSLKHLVDLRHLILGMPRYSYSLQRMPCGIGRLTQLQTLPRFVVGEGNCAAGIEELTNLCNLRGELVINVRSLSSWVNVVGSKRNELNVLRYKNFITSLDLEFYDDGVVNCRDPSLSASIRHAEEFMEIIQPNMGIRKLVIHGYMGSRFPKWMADPFYSRLQSICLDSCRNCRRLPALGWLRFLKHLEVRFMDELRCAGHEFWDDGTPSGPLFPVLEQLHLYCLPELEGLLVGSALRTAFPHLHLLHIQDCQKLKHIKLGHLASLRELHVAGCDDLTELNFREMSISVGLQPDVVGPVNIPHIDTLRLEFCQKLNFPSARQWLPPSLQRFEITGSPLLEEWARRHLDA